MCNNNKFILSGEHIWHEYQSKIWSSVTNVDMSMQIEQA